MLDLKYALGIKVSSISYKNDYLLENMMNTSTLNFVTLHVSDVNITAKQLCQLFNWKILYTGKSLHKHQTVHIGNDRSRLVIQPATNTERKPTAANKALHRLFNIGVEVEDIAVVEQQVIKAGLPTYAENESSHQREFRFSDSDGIEYHVTGKATNTNELTRRWMKELGKLSRFGAMMK